MVIRNHSRFSFRRSYGFLFCALAVLLMSWEGQRLDAAIAEGAIPEESIRLRILANSDSPQDQAVKRHVRDAIVEEMAGWAEGPQTIEQARMTIQSKLQVIEAIIANELESRGFKYGYDVELGVVPFPTKMYGSKVYPAGDYEALRVTLGKGAGQNWWCVLFPPLCFVDGVSGEATTTAAAATIQSVSSQSESGDPASIELSSENTDSLEVKFFLWEFLKSVIDFFRNLFS
ncbi:stage II sporulation protein R [Paenibacillus tarimensis]